MYVGVQVSVHLLHVVVGYFLVVVFVEVSAAKRYKTKRKEGEKDAERVWGLMSTKMRQRHRVPLSLGLLLVRFSPWAHGFCMSFGSLVPLLAG